MQLTPLHDAWLAQLAEQEQTTMLITGAALLVILMVVLAESRYRPLLLIVTAVGFGLVTLALFLFNPPRTGGPPMIAQPLWYVIEWVALRLIGESEIALRLPALAFGLLGVCLCYRLGLALGCTRQVSGWSPRSTPRPWACSTWL